MVVRAVWIGSTWFKADDIVYTYHAATHGWDWSYIVGRRDGHLMPGALTLVWLLHALFGTAWWPVVVLSSSMYALAAWLTWRVLVSLVGNRAVVLVMLVALLWNPATLDASMWWASGMQFLPLQIGFPAVILLVQRAIRSRRLADAALTGGALLGTLLFAERAFFIVPFVVALCLAMPLADGAGATPRERIRSATRPIGALVVVSAVWTLCYLVSDSNQVGFPATSFDQVRGAGWNLVVHNLVPSLAGGPWTWLQVGENGVLSIPTDLAVTLTTLGALSLVVLTIARRPHVLRFWGVLAVYIVLALLALRAGRIGALGFAAGFVPRYAADSVLPAIIVITLAVLRNRFDSPTNDLRPQFRMPPSLTGRALERRVVPLAAVALAASGAVSSVDLVDIASYAPAEAYVQTAVRSLDDHDGPVELISLAAPAEVMSPLFFPDNSSATVLAPVSDRFRFVEAAADPHIVAADGTVVSAEVGGVLIPLDDDDECLTEVGEGGTERLDLGVDVFDWAWYATVTYTAEGESYLVTSLDSDAVGVAIDRREGSITFPISGKGDHVEFGVLGADVCVREFRLGLLYEVDAPAGGE